jgi:hypothetical protein
MQKIVFKHLDEAIPSVLTALEVWRRIKAMAVFSQLLMEMSSIWSRTFLKTLSGPTIKFGENSYAGLLYTSGGIIGADQQ